MLYMNGNLYCKFVEMENFEVFVSGWYILNDFSSNIQIIRKAKHKFPLRKSADRILLL